MHGIVLEITLVAYDAACIGQGLWDGGNVVS